MLGGIISEDNPRDKAWERIFDQYRGKKLVIPLRGSPDPDSIGSAVALQHLLAQKGIESVISHTAPVSHPQNMLLIELLGIELDRFNPETQTPQVYLAPFAGYCLVDSQRADESLYPAIESKPLVALLDHHHTTDHPSALLVDIRTDVGSTATLLAQHLERRGLLKQDDSPSKKVAIALMHGIYSDTCGTIAATPADYKALAYLSQYFDRSTLKKILSEQISEGAMSALVQAYQKRTEWNGSLFTFVGEIQAEQRDTILPQVADILQRLAGVTTVVVGAVVEGQVQASLRSSNGQNLSALMETRIPELRTAPGASYGSRNGCGGFALPLTSLSGADPETYLKSRFLDEITTR
ncbi:DHH family phosphoesterase [Candidatus Woesearchaeota archaeon]|nr:DHH family phosphoesterase [Candidatus Woesearchaeota archaeon]